MSDPRRAAAFLRVEEILLPPHAVASSLHAALNAPGWSQRLQRLGLFAASLPALGVLRLRHRQAARRLSGLHYRGLGHDRLELLGREFFDRFLAGRVRPGGKWLIDEARASGRIVVLVTGGLEVALAPLCRQLNTTLLVGSQLELRDGRATGRLIDRPQSEWLATFAQEHQVDLAASYAYGSDAGDAALLRAVGFPCAVNPDPRLRQLADDEGWPILELEAGTPLRAEPPNPASRRPVPY